MIDKNEACGCGQEHNHCGCGHAHDQDGHHCDHDGCGSDCCNQTVILITEEEKAFLLILSQIPFLPLTQFVMKSSKNEHAESVALAPVFMNDRTESMENVKKTGLILKSLEDKGIISLDYDKPLAQGDYSVYEESDLYKYFCNTVREAEDREDFTFDRPMLEYGSIALTALGLAGIESLED